MAWNPWVPLPPRCGVAGLGTGYHGVRRHFLSQDRPFVWDGVRGSSIGRPAQVPRRLAGAARRAGKSDERPLMNPESAGDAPAIDTVLSNGLRVRILPDGSVPIVSCWVGYRVGSRDEFPGITGASHCNQCPAGKYNSQGDASCEVCPPGWVTDTLSAPGASSCAAWPKPPAGATSIWPWPA